MVKVQVRSDTVHEVLAKCCMTQRELADQLDISPAFMSQLLNGSRCPGPRVRARMLNAPALRRLGFERLFRF